MDESQAPAPLTGIRVIELGGIGPGPHACMMMADLGADVVAVLRPGEFEREKSESGHLMRRGRTVIELNLKTQEDREEFFRLAENADVVVDVYRPGVTERLGIGPEECRRRNDRLIYGRITGWGQDGPLSAMAGHDINYLSLTGHLHAITREGETPVPPLNLVADFGGGSMYLVMGVLAALVQRSSTGRGQIIDAAITDGTSALGALIWALRAVGQWSDTPGTNLLDTGRPYYDVYPCADGKFMAVGCLEPQFFAEFAAILGLDSSSPGQFDTDRAGELRAAIAQRMRLRTRDEWWALFRGTDACATPVLTYAEALEDEHMSARQAFLHTGHGWMPAPAPRFSLSDRAKPGEPPESVLDSSAVWA
ncbi:CaiB/BaiF CoA transferase family protein [Dietzia maris]